MERLVIKNLAQLKKWFSENDVDKVAFDTETTGLNYYYLTIVGCSFCNGKSACYIDLTDNEGEVADTEMLDFLRCMFATRIKRIVMHKAQYDLKVLHKHGIIDVTDRIFDTKTAAHLIDENDQTGLKYLAGLYLNVDVANFKDAVNEGYHTPKFYEYGQNDAIWTWQLHEIMTKHIETLGMHRLFYEIEMPFQFVLMDLEVNGIAVDFKRIVEIEREMRECIVDFESQLLAHCGKKHRVQPLLMDCGNGLEERTSPINFNSNVQVADYVKAAGVELEMTPSGKPKIDKDVLEEHKHIPFIKLLWKYRIALDTLSKFVTPMKSFVCGDGRIRANFHNSVATTGRMSCSQPPLQGLRKIKKLLPVDCRSAFVASEGYTMISADYAAQELRVLAHESSDPNMIEAFVKNQDLHLKTARSMFDLPVTDEQLCNDHPDHKELADVTYKNERHKGKNGVNFPIVYGSVSYSIAKANQVTEEEAQRWIDTYFKSYPGVKARKERVINDIKNKRYVKNLVGRRRNFKHPFIERYGKRIIDPRAIRQGFNFIIQGFSAEMLRLSMVRIRALSKQHPEWDLRFILTVHDEVVMEVRDKYVDVVLPKIKDIMENCVRLKVPVKVDIGTGKNYSEAK